MDVGKWASTVQLAEFPEFWFNTVMFADAIPETDVICS
jgi:hypothetical protein